MFLGERVGFFVTETEQEAYAAIEKLKKDKKEKLILLF